MTCASCELLLERKLKAIPGITHVDINHRTGIARLRADSRNLPDEVFGDKIDNPIRMLADLRNVDNYHPDRLLEHVGIDILNPSDRTNAAGDVWHERVLRIQQANTIGFNYFDSNIFTDDVYDAFVKQAAQFFPEKGTGTFTSFLGFCLNAVLDMASLWSEDHKLFYTDSEVASLVGFNEVYEGGTYYPTPHIELTIDAESSSTVSIDKLVELFYKNYLFH
jgi:copper chaperone CopZ